MWVYLGNYKTSMHLVIPANLAANKRMRFFFLALFFAGDILLIPFHFFTLLQLPTLIVKLETLMTSLALVGQQLGLQYREMDQMGRYQLERSGS